MWLTSRVPQFEFSNSMTISLPLPWGWILLAVFQLIPKKRGLISDGASSLAVLKWEAQPVADRVTVDTQALRSPGEGLPVQHMRAPEPLKIRPPSVLSPAPFVLHSLVKSLSLLLKNSFFVCFTDFQQVYCWKSPITPLLNKCLNDHLAKFYFNDKQYCS